MAERDADSGIGCALSFILIVATIIFVLFLKDDTAQLRDLQRRVGQLEVQVKQSELRK